MRLIHFNSNIIINLFEPRWSREATFMTRKVIKACNLKRSGVSIMLSNDRQIQKLNHKWKGKNIPTNDGEHVRVMLNEVDGIDNVLLVKVEEE